MPAMSNAVPWSTEVLMNGSPRLTLTLFAQLCTLIAMWPWSWYIASTTSNLPSIAWLNTVSGGMGPVASTPWDRAASTAGEMCFSSSSPIRPPSLAWGFSAAIAIRGVGKPHRVKCSCVSIVLASTLSRVT